MVERAGATQLGGGIDGLDAHLAPHEVEWILPIVRAGAGIPAGIDEVVGVDRETRGAGEGVEQRAEGVAGFEAERNGGVFDGGRRHVGHREAIEDVGRRDAVRNAAEKGMAAEKIGDLLVLRRIVDGVMGVGEDGGLAEGHVAVAVVVGVAGGAVGPRHVVGGEASAQGGGPVEAPLVVKKGIRLGARNAVAGGGGNENPVGLVQVVGETAGVALFHGENHGAGQVFGEGFQVAIAEPFVVPQAQFDVPFAAARGGSAVVGQENEEPVLRRQLGSEIAERVADARGGGIAIDVALAVVVEVERRAGPVGIGRDVVEIEMVDGRIGSVGDQDDDVFLGIAVFVDEGVVEEGAVAPEAVGVGVGGLAAGDDQGAVVGRGDAIEDGVGGAGALQGRRRAGGRGSEWHQPFHAVGRGGGAGTLDGQRTDGVLDGHGGEIGRDEDVAAGMAPVGRRIVIAEKHPAG